MKQIKIIDLFSGPGGLGEGFAALKDKNKQKRFKIAISIEKEKSAHRTLLLRAFFRQFETQAPAEYYDFLKGELGKTPEDKLYSLFPKEAAAARKEALCLELGKDNNLITSTIKERLKEDDCILIGGPPCQAYSTAGVARNKGILNYNSSADHRNFLYKEYLAIIAKFQPQIFVMENVKGMLSAKVDGSYIYPKIYLDLKTPSESSGNKPFGERISHSYNIYSLVADNDITLKSKDYIIQSEKFGIPQKRHRVILIGVRCDIEINHKINLIPSDNILTIADILSDLPKLRSGLSKEENSNQNWLKLIKQHTKNAINEINIHYPKVAKTMQTALNSLPNDLKQGGNLGLVKTGQISKVLADWYSDPLMEDHVCNHETRGHLASDLARYLFCSCWAKTNQETSMTASPKSHDFPLSLIPNHKNFKTGKFYDRFRVQVSNQPATTITSHISKDGHYYIHPDPLQCRSLTVREVARIQTFPDNYFFVGTRTQQYVQVGNAVPPLLAYQIAQSVLSILEGKK